MERKYLLWNFIGIAVGLVLIFIGYKARENGIEALEVPLYSHRMVVIPNQSNTSIQNPFSLGVIIIGLNLLIIFYKILTKGQK